MVVSFFAMKLNTVLSILEFRRLFLQQPEYNRAQKGNKMLKIVVFDGGCGAETVANFLQFELSTVDVVPVIDWQNAPYDKKSLPEVYRLVEKALEEYLDKVDLIVLGGYTVTQALNFLQAKYPQQKFVGLGVNYYQVLKCRKYPERVTVMMNENLYHTELLAEIRESLPFSRIILPDCGDWEELANTNELSRAVIYDDLVDYFELSGGPVAVNLSDQTQENKPILEMLREQKQDKKDAEPDPLPRESLAPAGYRLIKSDAVLLLNTNFWEAKPDFEDLFGYKVRVLDFRQKLLHDVCATLELLGVDGRRSK